jgi:hypothetical protein
MRVSIQKYVYQANDPLVHYMTSDLSDIADDVTNARTMNGPVLRYLVTANDRYMPWNTPGNLASLTLNGVPADGVNGQNYLNILSYKDPLVEGSENWDFPSYRYPTVGWLGRVHRGTPWQTVYLKAANVWNLTTTIGASPTPLTNGPATWQLWTGNVYNYYDAYNTLPVWDRLLFDLFTATPNDDATRGQLSVNIGADDPNNPLAGLSSWSALLSGSLAFSNYVIDARVNYHAPVQEPDANLLQLYGPYYNTVTAQPAGLGGANSILGQIVQNINATRTNFSNIDGLHGVFEHVGDVLAASSLSVASPFMRAMTNGVSDAAQQQYSISDEMYEWMPQQLLGLMTVSGTPQAPPRYVVYCYGQTLKPAPNGIVSSGTFFGMCTNYQVTAETAARAVIRVVNSPTPENPNATPRIVIEQYNPLPPD